MTNPFATEVPLTELSGEVLRARTARAQLYLIDMRRQEAGVSEDMELKHLRYLYQLEKRGLLYGSGPIDPLAGSSARFLAIIGAASREGAETIAADDPLQKAGLSQNTVREHRMNEGVACYVGRAISKRAATVAAFTAETDSMDVTLEELRARAARAPLHLIWLNSTNKPRNEPGDETGLAHFIWLRENEMAARLMSCGPVLPETPLGEGIWGSGLGIVATSRAEAERMAEAEPSGREGYRSLSVESWQCDYGIAAPIAKALVALNSLP